MSNTRSNIIEAAVVSFAEKGFKGTSIREVTKAAGANIAAVNYHFGSKEDLFREMLRSRIEPMNQERIRLLEDAQAAAPNKKIPLQKIVSFMVRPMFNHILDKDTSGFHFMRAVGKSFDDGPDFMREFHKGTQKEYFEKFMQAIADSCGTPVNEKIWYSFHFTMASIIGSMRHHHRLNALSNGKLNLDDREDLINHLIAFINGGIRASLKTK